MRMTQRTGSTSYEAFSTQAEYLELNRSFVQNLPIEGRNHILDLACGTGTMRDLILQRLRFVRITGLDLSFESLQIAKEHASSGSVLIQGTANLLPFPDAVFDFVVMGNSIQLLTDKRMLVREIGRVLRPGGLLAFNTSFYSGTYVAGTERVYLLWMEMALRFIQEENERRRVSGADVIKRRKTGSRTQMAQPWLSAAEYGSLLEGGGFRKPTFQERTVSLRRENLEAIGSYSGLASVLLDGYPVDIACQALERSVSSVFEAASVDCVPRNWLECLAVKEDH